MTDEVLTPREVLLRLNIEKQKKTIEALRRRIEKLRASFLWCANGANYDDDYFRAVLKEDDRLEESMHER